MAARLGGFKLTTVEDGVGSAQAGQPGIPTRET